MADTVMPGPVCDLNNVREAVCVHTRKIFDSCRDKDCVEDLRFYPTASAQEVLSACQMVRGGTAELLYVYETMVQQQYSPGCMQRRNRYMVDHASLLIAVHDGLPGGTRRTIEYALRRGIGIVDIPVG